MVSYVTDIWNPSIIDIFFYAQHFKCSNMYMTHTCTTTPHATNYQICEVWFTCDIKWVLHAYFTVEFLPYRFEYANEVACMINEAFHNADGTPKSRRGVLLYITRSWSRMELISMVMQATNPVHFLKILQLFYCILKSSSSPSLPTQIADSIKLVSVN